MNIIFRIVDFFCPISTPEIKIDIGELEKKVEDKEKKAPIENWPNIHFGD